MNIQQILTKSASVMGYKQYYRPETGEWVFWTKDPDWDPLSNTKDFTDLMLATGISATYSFTPGQNYELLLTNTVKNTKIEQTVTILNCNDPLGDMRKHAILFAIHCENLK